MVLGEAMLVPDLTDNLLSVRAVDSRGGLVVFVGDACYILSDAEAVLSSGVMSNASVIASVNEFENYVLKVTPVKALASAASKRMDGEAELWHRGFKNLGFENLKRVVGMVDAIPASVTDAERILGTICVPCVDGQMGRSPHHRSITTSTECALVHTDVDGPFTGSLGGSVYFMTMMEDSTGLITVTPIKSKGNARPGGRDAHPEQPGACYPTPRGVWNVQLHAQQDANGRRRFCHRASMGSFKRFEGDTVWCPIETAAFDLEWLVGDLATQLFASDGMSNG